MLTYRKCIHFIWWIDPDLPSYRFHLSLSTPCLSASPACLPYLPPLPACLPYLPTSPACLPCLPPLSTCLSAPPCLPFSFIAALYLICFNPNPIMGKENEGTEERNPFSLKLSSRRMWRVKERRMKRSGQREWNLFKEFGYLRTVVVYVCTPKYPLVF